MLIAASGKGVCAITINTDRKILLSDIKKRFPKAELTLSNNESEALMENAVKAVEQPSSRLNFNLDMHGTPFQMSVWKALRQIPYGKTASYGEIAKKIGKPKAVRAVAQACSANPVAVLVPCHRVIRSDASLSGYRWGAERKRKLLQREQKK